MYRENYELDEVSLYVNDKDTGFPTVETNAVVHGLSADLEWDAESDGWIVDRLYDNQGKRIDDVAGYAAIVTSVKVYVDRLDLREAA